MDNHDRNRKSRSTHKKRSRKRRDCQEKVPHSTISHTSNGASATPPKEFPGYYFDPEKNKYFKISSDYPKSLMRNNDKLTSQINTKIDTLKRVTTLSYIRSREMPSVLNPEIFKRKGLEQWTTQLVERKKITSPMTQGYFYSIIEITRDCRKMLIVERSTQHHRMEFTNWACLYEICYDSTSIQSLKLCRKYKFGSEVTNVQFNPNPHMQDSFLVSVLGSGTSPGYVATILNNGSTVNKHDIQNGSVWYSCWCHNPHYSQLIAVAKSTGAILVDHTSQIALLTLSYPSDVFCVEFSHKTPIFYFGCRNGYLACVDIRTMEIVKSFKFHKQSSVSSIKMMHDENYFMASNVNGMVKMWDVRLSKPIKNYLGNINETKLIPFVMDSSETFIISAGQDGMTRVWSIDDGQILKEIPCPSQGCVPAVCFGEQWGINGEMMALTLASENTITMYY